jgi:hypothetical protein
MQVAGFDKDLLQDRFQISLWPTMVLINEHRAIVSMGEANQLPLAGEHLSDSLRAVFGKAGLNGAGRGSKGICRGGICIRGLVHLSPATVMQAVPENYRLWLIMRISIAKANEE